MKKISAVVAALVSGVFASGCASDVDSSRLSGDEESTASEAAIPSEAPAADVSGLPEASDDLRQSLVDSTGGTCGRLYQGRSISGGQAIYSCGTAGSRFTLAMQTDGNLVIYGLDGRALWNTGTWGNPGARAIMQTDGNFVVYSSAGRALWNSATFVAGSYLDLSTVGSLIIWYPGGRNGISLSSRTQSRMAIKTTNGKYLSAQGGGGGAVLANAGAVGAWETFVETSEGGGNYSYRTIRGNYLSAIGGGGGALNAAPGAVGAWELFSRPQPFGDTRIALRTFNGHYVSASKCGSGGDGTVNSAPTYTWFCEAFSYVNTN